MDKEVAINHQREKVIKETKKLLGERLLVAVLYKATEVPLVNLSLLKEEKDKDTEIATVTDCSLFERTSVAIIKVVI